MADSLFEILLVQSLLEGLVDEIGLWEIVRILKRNNVVSEANRKENAIGFIVEVVERGLFQAGIFEHGKTFKEFHLNGRDLAKKIRVDWDKLGRDPDPGEVVYLLITKKGRIEAEKYQKRG